MTRDEKIIGYGLLLCAVALTGFLCWGIYQERQDSRELTASAATSITGIAGQLGGAVAQLTASAEGFDDARAQIVTEIVRPCRAAGDTADNCGFLAETKKAEAKIGDAVVTAQLQVQGSQKLMNAAASALTGAAGDIHESTTHLNTTLDAATTAIGGFQSPLANLAKVEDTSNLLLEHIDALAQSHDVKDIVTNGAKTSASIASIAGTSDAVAKKEGNKILHPNRWSAAYPWLMLGGKTAACIWAGAC